MRSTYVERLIDRIQVDVDQSDSSEDIVIKAYELEVLLDHAAKGAQRNDPKQRT